MNNIKHIHFIGICGVAMGALALAFKRQGYRVTGSDAGFHPPMSTHLEQSGVEFYPGWHPEKMGRPDLVVVGNVASSTNPEWLHVQNERLAYCSYPELVRDYFIKKNSIVAAGTFGKTTSTTLLAWILTVAGKHPSYMLGGLSPSDFPAANLADSDWSIVEGDEYKASRSDSGPKFAYYKPTHLLLTSVVWDHADVYPTEDLYRAAFQKLVSELPAAGLLVISEKATPIIPRQSGLKTVTYGSAPNTDFSYSNLTSSYTGLTFDITHAGTTYQVMTKMLGDYMADNITGCFALAYEIGIPANTILAAIASFPGIRRRLEKRYIGRMIIFDDIAHSPSKALGVLRSLKHIYKKPLTAIFEPNTGNRQAEAEPWYDGAFADADEVIIPRLTNIKKNPNVTAKPFEATDLTRIISKTHPKVVQIDDDAELVRYIKEKTPPGGVVAFLGSHGFRGMIEQLVGELKNEERG